MSAPEKAAEPVAASAGLFARVKSAAAKHWIVTVVGVSLVVHGVAFFTLRSGHTPAHAEAPATEVSLGRFVYRAERPPLPEIRSAEFELHLSPADPSDAAVQSALKTRRFKLQQDIEQLVRQAQGGDFDDPKLTELKRRLRAQINESLGLKAAGEVIITGLAIQRAPASEQPPVTAASHEPAKPAG